MSAYSIKIYQKTWFHNMHQNVLRWKWNSPWYESTDRRVMSTAKKHKQQFHHLRNPDPWPVQALRLTTEATGEFGRQAPTAARWGRDNDNVNPTTSALARRRNAETGSFNPLPPLCPNRIRQNQSQTQGNNATSPRGTAAKQRIQTKRKEIRSAPFFMGRRFLGLFKEAS
jgi:hypothetical protein